MSEKKPVKNLLIERLKRFEVAYPPCQPIYDRIFVWPLDDTSESETYAGTRIIKSQKSKDYLGASRGLVIAAGLKALDELWGHGVELGHIVWFARLSPWRREYEGQGKLSSVVVLRATEIVGSEDLMQSLKAGDLEIGTDTDGRHVFTDRARVDPFTGDEGI